MDMPPKTLTLEEYLAYSDGTDARYELVNGVLSDTDPKSRERDYVEKRREYADFKVPEYWIVDPVAHVVCVLTLVDKSYQERKFTDDEVLRSSRFSAVDWTAAQLLQAGL